MPKTIQTSFKFPDDILDKIDVLAERFELSRTDVVMEFLRAGIGANAPVTGEEIAEMKRRRTRPARSSGLVIPMAPLASGNTRVVVEEKKRGGGDSPHRCAPSHLVAADRRAPPWRRAA